MPELPVGVSFFSRSPEVIVYFSDFKIDPTLTYSILLLDILSMDLKRVGNCRNYCVFKGKILDSHLFPGLNPDTLAIINLPESMLSMQLRRHKDYRPINHGHWDIYLRFKRLTRKVIDITELKYLKTDSYNPSLINRDLRNDLLPNLYKT